MDTGIVDGPPIPLFEICVRCWAWDCSGCGPGRRVEAFKIVKTGVEDSAAKNPRTCAARYIVITYPNERDLRLESAEDLKRAHLDSRMFIQQVRRTHGPQLEYVRVTEPTKRGRIHLNLITTGPSFLRKCSDKGRRTRGLPTGPGSGSPCYCPKEKPCLQRIAWGLGMGWVNVERIWSPAKAAAYVGKYLAKGVGDTRWPKYARRLSRSNKWGSLTFGQLRLRFIEHVRQMRRDAGEPADLPSGDLVWELVPFGEPPLGVNRSTGEVFLPSRLR